MRFYRSIRVFSFLTCLIGVLFLLPQTSQAQVNSQSCGFNSIGDWVCPQGTAAGGGGAGPLSGGGNPFSSGGPLFSTTLPGGGVTQSALEAMFAALSPSLQACATQAIASTNIDSLSLSDILNLISNIMTLQGGLQSIPDTVTCPDGRTVPNPGMAYMQQAYVNQACTSTSGSLISGSNPFSALSSSLSNNMSNSACNNSSGQGQPTGNSGGGSPLPPGAPGATGSCAPVNSGSLDADIYAELEREEGVRNCAYRDSLGKPTIGIGHLIVPGDGYDINTCLTDAQVQTLTQNDMASRHPITQGIMSGMGVNNHEFYVAMFSVVWQMGDIRSRFPTLWGDLQAGDYTGACTRIKGWAWHRQTPRRTNNFCHALHNLANCVTPGSAPVSQREPQDLTQDSGFRGESPPSCMTDGVNNWDQAKSDIAFDNELGTVGYCARGVRTILQNIPGSGVTGSMGHAYQYQSSLPSAGYTLLTGFTPQTAPVGCILVYDRNSPPGSGGGAAYGHVEIVVTKRDGTRGYISDHFASRPGGTVINNYVGCYSNTGGPAGGQTTNAACSAQQGGGQGANYTPIGAQAGGGGGGPFGSLGSGPLGSLGGLGNVFSGGSALLSGGVLNPSAWVNTTLNSLSATAISGFQSALNSQLSGIVSDLQEMTNIQNLMDNIGMDQIMQFADNLGPNFFESITTFDPQVFLEGQLSGIMQDAQDILGEFNTVLDGVTSTIEGVIEGGIEGIMGPINNAIQDTLNNSIINQIDLGLQELVNDQLQLDILPNLDSIISAGGLTAALEGNIVSAVETQAQALIDNVVNDALTGIQAALPTQLSLTEIADITTQVRDAINGDLASQIQSQVLDGIDSQITSAISGFTPPSGDEFRVETFMGQVISAERRVTDAFGFSSWQDMNITIP